MVTPELLPPDKQLTAFDDIWNVIRTCEFNVIFHRKSATRVSRWAKGIDIFAGLLATIAGVGILADIKWIPDSTWAIVAFFSGISGQFRSVFGLPDTELEHRKHQNDYASVLSAMKSVVDRAKDASGLTYELDVQRRLVTERYNFVMERDENDYDSEKLAPIQAKVDKMYPPDSLWLPPTPEA